MLGFVKLILLVLGISAIFIRWMIFIGGPRFTASGFGAVFTQITGVAGYSGTLFNSIFD